MSTQNSIQEAKEAISHAEKILCNNISTIQDIAWRSIHNFGESNTSVAILCIEAGPSWNWFIDDILRDYPHQDKINREEGRTVCILTKWEVYKNIAFLFPIKSEYLEKEPKKGKVRTHVLTNKGLFVFEVIPKASPIYN